MASLKLALTRAIKLVLKVPWIMWALTWTCKILHGYLYYDYISGAVEKWPQSSHYPLIHAMNVSDSKEVAMQTRHW